MKPMICVDFDNTIWDGYKVYDGCIDALNELREKYMICVFSARPTQAERIQMKQLLDSNRIPYDTILDIKPNAAFFIDDKGVRFNGSWKDVLDICRQGE